MTIHINVLTGLQAALQALDEGRLSAQRPNNEKCLYRSPDGSPCVIGAMFSDQQWKKDIYRHILPDSYPKVQKNRATLLALLKQRVVTLDPPANGAVILDRLQMIHDNWRLWRLTDHRKPSTTLL